MKTIKRVYEVEVEVLEYTDIAAKILTLQANDSIDFNKKDFEDEDLQNASLKAFDSLGIKYSKEISPSIKLYEHPRHKSLTYTTKWNDAKDTITITRL